MSINDVLIDPIVYFRILLHVKRFANEKIQEKNYQNIYGALVGYIEDGIRFVINYIPLFHSIYQLDFERKHLVFNNIDNLIDELEKREENDQIIGWVHSINSEEIKISDIDKKNQIYLQTAYNKEAILLFVSIPALEYDYGIDIRCFKDHISKLDNDSTLSELSWDFDDFNDIGDLFNLIKHLNDIKGTEQPLIKESGEVSIK